MITASHLPALFTFHPPSETTEPKHRKVNESFRDAATMMREVFQSAEVTPAHAYDRINDTLRKTAEVILEQAPPSADTTTAIRSLRAARMLSNEAVTILMQQNAQLAPLVHKIVERASLELTLARMWANSAIALEGRV